MFQLVMFACQTILAIMEIIKNIYAFYTFVKPSTSAIDVECQTGIDSDNTFARDAKFDNSGNQNSCTLRKENCLTPSCCSYPGGPCLPYAPCGPCNPPNKADRVHPV